MHHHLARLPQPVQRNDASTRRGFATSFTKYARSHTHLRPRVFVAAGRLVGGGSGNRSSLQLGKVQGSSSLHDDNAAHHRSSKEG